MRLPPSHVRRPGMSMFETHFGFQHTPFAATPDPRSFFTTPRLQEQVDELVVRLAAGQGICLLTGGAGLGKSLFCRVVAQQLAAQCHVLYIAAPAVLTPRSLIQSLLTDLDHTLTGLDLHELRLALQQTLREQVRGGRPCALLVDEAHLLPRRLFEELRALTVSDEEGQPLLRLLLTGQPRLEEMLTGAEFDAVNQQLVCHLLLEPLSLTESVEYVLHRVYWAGGDTAGLFSIPALDLIVQVSSGIPRLLNRLCDQSLLVTHAAELPQVGLPQVEAALESLRHLPLPWNEEFLRQRRLATPTPEAADRAEFESSLQEDFSETPESEGWSAPIGFEGEATAVAGTGFEEPAWGADVIEPETDDATNHAAAWPSTADAPRAMEPVAVIDTLPARPGIAARPALPWEMPSPESPTAIEVQNDFEPIEDPYEPVAGPGSSQTFDEQALALEWSRRLRQEIPGTMVAAPPEPPREIPIEGRVRTIETPVAATPAMAPTDVSVHRSPFPGVLTPRFATGSLSERVRHDPEFDYDVIEPDVPASAPSLTRRLRLANGIPSKPIVDSLGEATAELLPSGVTETVVTAPAETGESTRIADQANERMTVSHPAHPIPAPQSARAPGIGRLFSLLRGKTAPAGEQAREGR
jgi:type II secretory pathway predicted ATPase ExeA